MAITRKLLPIILISGLLAGCQTADEYKAARIKKVDEAFKKLKGNDLPTTKPLSLPYCIDLALKNNLDMKVYSIQQTVDNERRTAAMLGMLPDLIVSDGMDYRNNEPGAKSEGIATGQQSLEYSYSSQQYENRVKVEMLFSVIDFGLAYFNSVQTQDKLLLSGEEQRRAAQNLILDVTGAYLRVASAQYEMEKVEAMLKECESTETALNNITTSRGISKSDALVEEKKFINLKLQLREYRRDYENSSIQLRSLMGYYPTNEIKVDTSIIDRMTTLSTPDVDLLEEIALFERPELYQLDIQQHVTNVEARKKILMMFPNVQAFVDFTGDSNIYLYNRTWWEIGARAAYNLLKLPEKIAEYRALDAQADQIDAQSLALSVGIISQVRIAHASLQEEKERFELYDKKYQIYRDHVEYLSRQSAGAKNVSPFELTRIKMEAVGAAIERAQALGNYYLAYYRVLNSIGVENLNKNTLLDIKKRMEANLAEMQQDSGKDTTAIASDIENKKAEIVPVQEEIDNLKKKINALESELAMAPADESSESDIADKKEDLASYNEELGKLEAQKAEIEKEAAELEKSKTDAENSFAEYSSSIKKYSDAMDKMASDKSYESTLNLEMTQNMTGNLITPEEYTPSTQGNIDIEAQKNAGNNSIDSAEVTPSATGNLTDETLYNEDKNNINVQELNQ